MKMTIHINYVMKLVVLVLNLVLLLIQIVLLVQLDITSFIIKLVFA